MEEQASGPNSSPSALNSIRSRKSPRRALRADVGFLIRGRYQILRSLQIGEGGMLLAGDLSKILAGSTSQSIPGVVLTVPLPSREILVLRAKILYELKEGTAKEPAFGVQFLDITILKKRSIRNYVSAKTESEARSENFREQAS